MPKHVPIQQALNDNETTTANLARAREDITILCNLLRDIQRKDAERTIEQTHVNIQRGTT